jgi:alpha-tubulin suppressor-like RCC1 family protein
VVDGCGSVLSNAPARSHYTSFRGESVVDTGLNSGVYTETGASTLQVSSASGGAVSVTYNLKQDFTWGTWASLRVETDAVHNLSGNDGLLLDLFVDAPTSAMLRLTLCDVTSNEDLLVHGADEMWWYDFDVSTLSQSYNWVTIRIPFSSFRLASGSGVRTNDGILDTSKIVAFELNLTTTYPVSGSFSFRSLRTYCGDGGSEADADAAPTDGGSGDEASLCIPSQTMCNTVCVDLQTDPLHCGNCTNRCSDKGICSQGSCTCPGIQPGLCNGVCTDLATDRDNCGACGHVCPWGCANAACIQPKQIALGQGHACACFSDGSVYCWGQNYYGERGFRMWDLPDAPIRVPGLTDVIQVALGEGFSCALQSTGSVLCWGSNGYGKLGIGLDPTSLGQTPTPTPIMTLRTGVVQVAAAGSSACALMADTSVRCWGNNAYGQLGDGTDANTRNAPVRVTDLADVEQIAVGNFHACALKLDGTVACWGLNDYGQLGYVVSPTQNVNRQLTPRIVPGVSDVKQIALGVSAPCTCVLKTDGSALCWGNNWYGQLGDGTENTRTAPAPVLNLSGAFQLASGDRQVCAVQADRTASCWGNNSFGQLGDGTKDNKNLPTPVSGLNGVSQIAAGYYHTCALLQDGSVMCWGYGGTLGTGDSAERLTPTAVVRPVE